MLYAIIPIVIFLLLLTGYQVGLVERDKVKKQLEAHQTLMMATRQVKYEYQSIKPYILTAEFRIDAKRIPHIPDVNALEEAQIQRSLQAISSDVYNKKLFRLQKKQHPYETDTFYKVTMALVLPEQLH